MNDAAPIVVSALFGPADHDWLDGLRRAHFPPERNILPAHLTLFHHLPPSIETELRARLTAATLHVPPPAARIAGPIGLGRGVALRVDSRALEAIRDELADAFAACLVPQDGAPWRPHVTIQNKVDPAIAATLRASLSRCFAPRPLAIAGLAAWRYRGGPWEPLSRHMFSRSGRALRS